MKKIIFLLISFFLLFNLNLYAQEKITYLDIDYLIKNTIKGKKLISKLENNNKININELEKKEKLIIDLKNDINSKKNILSQTELDKSIEKLNNLVLEFNETKKNLSNDIEIKKNLEISNFFKDIRPIIESYMLENEITIIIEKKNILLANQSQEITMDILKLIDSKFK